MAENDTRNENLQALGEIDRVIHEPARLLILAYPESSPNGAPAPGSRAPVLIPLDDQS